MEFIAGYFSNCIFLQRFLPPESQHRFTRHTRPCPQKELRFSLFFYVSLSFSSSHGRKKMCAGARTSSIRIFLYSRKFTDHHPQRFRRVLLSLREGGDQRRFQRRHENVKSYHAYVVEVTGWFPTPPPKDVTSGETVCARTELAPIR